MESKVMWAIFYKPGRFWPSTVRPTRKESIRELAPWLKLDCERVAEWQAAKKKHGYTCQRVTVTVTPKEEGK